MPFSARFGSLVVLLLLMVGLIGPYLAPYGEAEVVGDVWEPMFGRFLLGTDNLGRDILSRMAFGGRTTLFVALTATLASFAIGVLGGFFAAVHGGWLDQGLSRLVDLFMSFPTLILALVLLSVVPVNLINLILVMALLDSTRVYRIARALAADIAAMDFVEAARLRGEGGLWIGLREILPNAWPPLVAEFGLRFSFAILFLSALSFLGLGIQPPDADWGGMVKENKDGIAFGVTAALVPASAIALLTISVNLLVDGILARGSNLEKGSR